MPPGPVPSKNPTTSEEAREKSDAMPNISDVMLRKLKLTGVYQAGAYQAKPLLLTPVSISCLRANCSKSRVSTGNLY